MSTSVFFPAFFISLNFGQLFSGKKITIRRTMLGMSLSSCLKCDVKYCFTLLVQIPSQPVL